MTDMPTFRKPDRYKKSTYRAYNSHMLTRYDPMLSSRFYRIDLHDRAVLDELGESLESMSILDVGCATGRLLEKLAAAGAGHLSASG